ncbi:MULTISPECIES: RidA family protein [unclassified Herbaspirillum]|uniref:RidA family protein n=1 Tax=unclassified Herbaspirillum TaxID=2624150 RepID=UPI000E2ED81B|nr:MULTISPECIES: RidA family protein [unclassified Herbaspirillum]RFB68678.1 RidA family protein [Herbaspirillum sp. 3R-3a1]TFI05583.1 RidA family protein [Herbaspirillum sp. 3R11]TFI13507.1 RidA family protein [Herbaspirillum sp. 3R-11]TFI22122.1 RidA family protein [Herbaspirillum sp. 3C11]
MSTTATQAKPLGKYPYVKRAGDYLFVSGMSARLADGSVPGDVREQTHVVIGKIRDALQTLDADLADCVAITSYLVNMRDFDGYNAVYGEYFSQQGPTRTTVAVHQLPHADMLVELTATAYKPIE